MAEELGKDQSWITDQVRNFENLADNYIFEG